MGKIKQGILGGFSGKVANVIGSSWKGIAYMKSMPLSVANPKTALQVAQRTKLTNAVAFAKEILASVIKPLRDRFSVKMSGYNAFVQENIALFAAAMPSPAADLVIASGKMDKTVIDTLSGAAAQENIYYTWNEDSGEGFKLATDKAYAVAVNETTGDISFAAANETRTDESTIVAMPSNLTAGDVIRGYLVFLRADGTICSNTAYETYTVS